MDVGELGNDGEKKKGARELQDLTEGRCSGKEGIARSNRRSIEEHRRHRRALYPLGKEDEPHGAAALIPIAIPIIPTRKSVIRARPAELAFSPPFPTSSCFLVARTEAKRAARRSLFVPVHHEKGVENAALRADE
ncbi:hypothetical protein MRX96_059601 [Rhipicephalus microplus]